LSKDKTDHESDLSKTQRGDLMVLLEKLTKIIVITTNVITMIKMLLVDIIPLIINQILLNNLIFKVAQSCLVFDKTVTNQNNASPIHC
jgi:hypothetical protein